MLNCRPKLPSAQFGVAAEFESVLLTALPPNTTLQADDRHASVPATSELVFAPLAAER